MKVLVVGSGGREHAMARALALSRPRPRILVAPGNPGMAELAELHPGVAGDDLDALVALARDQAVDLVIPGPEAPLVAGLADRLAELGIPCCGPRAGAARLEGSKVFTREIAARVGAPSPDYRIVRHERELTPMVAGLPWQPVVKADGLASGKGVFLPDTTDECLEAAWGLLNGSLGEAGLVVVLEERLAGIEASLFYACHGSQAVLLPHARDHKRLLDDDRGPNTGGMGAISPNPAIDAAVERQVRSSIVLPVLEELERAGTPFVGFLFAGLMLTGDGPRLLEFNVRLGDPEAQAILPRIAEGRFLELCRRTATGDLDDFVVEVDPRPVCAVVAVAEGYPEAPRKGDPIEIEGDPEDRDRWVIHSGTRRDGGTLVTSGGRVLSVVAQDRDAATARARAYQGLERIRFEGMHYRSDIGRTATA